MSPVLALSAFFVVAALGLAAAWLYDRRLRSFPHDAITPKLYRARNLNVHATVALLVILQCGGYPPPPPGGEVVMDCDAYSPGVKWNSRSVWARVWVTCKTGLEPVRHSFYAELQYLAGGKWIYQDHARDERIPGNAKETTKVKMKVETDCVPGEWRLTTQVAYTDKEGKADAVKDPLGSKPRAGIPKDGC